MARASRPAFPIPRGARRRRFGLSGQLGRDSPITVTGSRGTFTPLPFSPGRSAFDRTGTRYGYGASLGPRTMEVKDGFETALLARLGGGKTC